MFKDNDNCPWSKYDHIPCNIVKVILSLPASREEHLAMALNVLSTISRVHGLCSNDIEFLGEKFSESYPGPFPDHIAEEFLEESKNG